MSVDCGVDDFSSTLSRSRSLTRSFSLGSPLLLFASLLFMLFHFTFSQFPHSFRIHVGVFGLFLYQKLVCAFFLL